MYPALFVIYALGSIVSASLDPIHVSECGTLDTSHATYKLMHDIAINDQSYDFVCLSIKGDGITLDGNGFELSSALHTLLPVTGVKYDGLSTTVTGMRITNLRTGIHANGMYGEVNNNTITHAVNGIDVSATNNKISNNFIGDFAADESASGIYVYFSPVAPVDSFINVTNNVIYDIRGDSFVVGISVYYANLVSIAYNQIINLRGEFTEDISVIYGSAEVHDNTFIHHEVYIPSASTLLLSLITLLVSMHFLRASRTSHKLEEVEMRGPEDERKEEDGEEYEMDGADRVKKAKQPKKSPNSSPQMSQ